MPPLGFEPTTPASERQQSRNFDCVAIRIGKSFFDLYFFLNKTAEFLELT
jgi:hypothetical protein